MAMLASIIVVLIVTSLFGYWRKSFAIVMLYLFFHYLHTH